MNHDITPAAVALAENFPWGCKVYPATAERLIQDAFNAEREAAVTQAKEEIARKDLLIRRAAADLDDVISYAKDQAPSKRTRQSVLETN